MCQPSKNFGKHDYPMVLYGFAKSPVTFFSHLSPCPHIKAIKDTKYFHNPHIALSEWDKGLLMPSAYPYQMRLTFRKKRQHGKYPPVVSEDSFERKPWKTWDLKKFEATTTFNAGLPNL